MHGGGKTAIGVARAEAVETGRPGLREISKILSGHPLVELHHVFGAEVFLGGGTHAGGEGGLIFQIRVAHANFQLAHRAHAFSQALAELAQVLVGLGAPRLVEGAEGAFDVNFVGNNISRAIGDNFAETQHGGNFGVGTAAHNLLGGHDDVGGHQHGVEIHFGHGPVATLAFDRQVDFIGAGHVAAGAQADFTGRQVREYVLPKDVAHGRIFQHALFYHQRRAAGQTFLAGLKHELHAAFELAFQLIEDASHTQQRGRVHIVAAGVHHAGVGRFVGHVVGFRNGQRVHVSPQGNGGAAGLAFNQGHHAGVGDGLGREAQLL